MMNIYDNEKTVSNFILSVSKKIFEIEGRTRNYGTDHPLYNSEIHVIKSIMENEGIHITALAETMNVTKGTISEVLMKLQKKGMVIKETDSNNLSRICLRLTQKGKIAYINHEALHKKFEQVIEQILNKEGTETKDMLFNFMIELDNALSNFEE